MKVLGKALLTVAVSLALVTTVSPAYGQAPTAKHVVTPNSHGPPTHPPKRAHDRTTQLSQAQKHDIALGVRLWKYSTTHWTSTLDYRLANKYDQGDVRFRRMFAAGWLKSKGHISGISKAELKKVRAYIPAGDPYQGLPRDVFGAPRCTGVTKTLANKNHSDIRMYLDSCQTAMVLASGPSLAILAGVLALIFPYAVGVVAVLSAAVGIGLLYLGYLRDISSLSAVILRYHYFLITGGPQ